MQLCVFLLNQETAASFSLIGKLCYVLWLPCFVTPLSQFITFQVCHTFFSLYVSECFNIPVWNNVACQDHRQDWFTKQHCLSDKTCPAMDMMSHCHRHCYHCHFFSGKAISYIEAIWGVCHTHSVMSSESSSSLFCVALLSLTSGSCEIRALYVSDKCR